MIGLKPSRAFGSRVDSFSPHELRQAGTGIIISVHEHEDQEQDEDNFEAARGIMFGVAGGHGLP